MSAPPAPGVVPGPRVVAEEACCASGSAPAAGGASPLTSWGGYCGDPRYVPDRGGGGGRACTPYPPLPRACGNGACVPGVCLTGFADCNTMIVDGCEVSTQSDPNNCGACGRACTSLPNASAMCAGGACTIGMCNANFANCDGQAMNGCEVNLQSDRTNCGACGNACDTGRVCIMGACSLQPLYRGLTSPIPGSVPYTPLPPPTNREVYTSLGAAFLQKK